MPVNAPPCTQDDFSLASQKKETYLALLVLILTGLNMRPLLTSIGPLLPQLRQAGDMSFTSASLLTVLPVMAMGVLALAGGWIGRYISERKNVVLSLLLIAAGALLREIAPRSGLLLSSAIVGGIGIGIIQAVIPARIKRQFSKRTSQVMGVWSAALMGGGGLGAVLTPWLAGHSDVWYHALAWWAVPAIVAIAAWGFHRERPAPVRLATARSSHVRLHMTTRAWVLGLYFGLFNGGYASLITWLPPYYMQLGYGIQFSGNLLAIMIAGQTFGALLLPMLSRHQDRRGLLLCALVLQLIGFCGFIWLPRQLPLLWGTLCGIGLGGIFPLSLVLALDHASDPAIARRLVAFMQGIGFLIAAISPFLSGLMRSLSGDYLLGWAFHAGCIIGLMLLTRRFAPAAFPAEWQIK